MFDLLPTHANGNFVNVLLRDQVSLGDINSVNGRRKR